MRVLINAGASVNKATGYTRPVASVFSLKTDPLAALRVLLDAGVDVRDPALRCANLASQHPLDCLLAVLAAGAPVNTQNHHGQNELDAIASAGLRYRPQGARDEVRRIIHSLVAAGCDPNDRSLEGTTPLHLTTEVVTFAIAPLIECGAYLDVRDKFGHTPLHIAVASSCTPNIEEHIYAGSDATITNDKGVTPLQLAQSRL